MNALKKLYKRLQERQLVSCSNDTRWRQLTHQLEGQLFRSRVKWIFAFEPTDWGTWFLFTDGYLEHSNIGPIPWREIEWLEIDSIERQFRGKLVPDREIDRSVMLASILNDCRAVFTTEGTIYRIWGYCSFPC